MKREFLKMRVGLILLGIGLGWLARLILGAPAEELGPLRTIDRPLQAVDEEDIDESVFHPTGDATEMQSGLVPPIKLPGTFAIFESSRRNGNSEIGLGNVLFDDYSHDESAKFEAHGEQLCASGCAASRHPTSTLTRSRFEQLIKTFAAGPMEETNESLEELVYFGPQTRKLIQSTGFGKMDAERASFLWDQLTYTHARISIRVVDEQGELRTWIAPTKVPLDRRHVFEMKTNDVQPLVTSGTVKRVGLNHVWTRL